MGAVPLAPHLRACGERGEDFATLGGVETVGIEDAEQQGAVARDGEQPGGVDVPSVAALGDYFGGVAAYSLLHESVFVA